MEGPYSPFVPAMVGARLARSKRETVGPDGWRARGAVLIIDITGFTALTERLSARGPGGAEALAAILDVSFGDVIGRIRAHGGDVVSFAGDAILAVWPTASATSIRAAARAAIEAQRLLGARPPMEGVEVRARAGIASGALWVGVVGGVRDEWRWVVGGTPLAAAGVAASRARPGQLVVTTEAAADAGLVGSPVEDASNHVAVGEVPDDVLEPVDATAAFVGQYASTNAGAWAARVRSALMTKDSPSNTSSSWPPTRKAESSGNPVSVTRATA